VAEDPFTNKVRAPRLGACFHHLRPAQQQLARQHTTAALGPLSRPADPVESGYRISRAAYSADCARRRNFKRSTLVVREAVIRQVASDGQSTAWPFIFRQATIQRAAIDKQPPSKRACVERTSGKKARQAERSRERTPPKSALDGQSQRGWTAKHQPDEQSSALHGGFGAQVAVGEAVGITERSMSIRPH